MDGVLKVRYQNGYNEHLKRYQSEMDADPVKLAELVTSPDKFDTSIPVYTYNEGKIIEKQCEVLGWPNCTHDGEIMYENKFFADKNDAVKDAKNDVICAVEVIEGNIKTKEAELNKSRALLRDYQQALIALNIDYPEIIAQTKD